MEDWKSFKIESEPHLKKLIRKKQREISPDNRFKLHIVTYTTHPFIDVYAVKCDKGMAFDCVASHIPRIEGKRQNIMYLGDSENDDPAFRKAVVSIGILSDIRLKPKLNCKYNICFNKLPIFLKGLLDKDLQFSDSLVKYDSIHSACGWYYVGSSVLGDTCCNSYGRFHSEPFYLHYLWTQLTTDNSAVVSYQQKSKFHRRWYFPQYY
jgi:haloacid dehalogenase-like hydrolase